MMSNGSITAWSRITGTRGDGEPALQELTLRHAVPVEVVAPSSFLRAQAASVGIELRRIAHVLARSLVAQGVEPAAGDRIALRTARPWLRTETLDIVGVRPLAAGGDTIALELGVRRDTQ